jgi:large subunit ribosomal protein L25
MSQSLRAIKQFRLRELVVASPKPRIFPAPTASAPNQPQRPPAPAVTTTTTTSSIEPSSLSGSSDVPTAVSSATAAAAIILNNPFVPHKNPKSGRWAPPKYSLRRQADLTKHARESATLHLLPPGPKSMSHAQQLQLQLATATTAAAAAPSSTLSVGSTVAGTQTEERETVVASGLVSVRNGLERERGLEEGTQGEDGEDGPVRGSQDSKDVAVGADDAWWARSVEWAGTVRERSVAGTGVGNRLYAGKKRMFKGHKWERERERRVARTKMLLRDMDQRVQRFRGVRYYVHHTHIRFFFFHIQFILFYSSLSLFLADGVSFLFSTVPRASRCRWQGGPTC